jgi:glutaredoxin
MLRVLVALVALLVGALPLASVAGCKRASSKASVADAGPPPIVRQTTEGLLFTYIDEHGDFHVVGKTSDVPDAAREVVRVIDPSRDEGASGETVFVVDLRTPAPDGTFPVRRMKRTELEALALARRPAGSGPPAAMPGPGGVAPNGAPDVIVYGAEWCGPCHQAAAFLTQRGVPFVEKNIEEDHEASREMQAKLARAGLHGGSIPVIDVRGTVLVGFSPQAIERALHR